MGLHDLYKLWKFKSLQLQRAKGFVKFIGFPYRCFVFNDELFQIFEIMKLKRWNDDGLGTAYFVMIVINKCVLLSLDYFIRLYFTKRKTVSRVK